MRYKDPNNVSKQKILLESFKLFATKPFSDITFTDIEKVTGLSRGAILYHFKSKDEILASIILNKPINEPHYFDLETGEELNYSLSFDPERKIYVTK